MKPRYRSKGKYSDGRKKIVIEYEEDGKFKSMALPKPEKLLDMVKRPEIKKEEPSA